MKYQHPGSPCSGNPSCNLPSSSLGAGHQRRSKFACDAGDAVFRTSVGKDEFGDQPVRQAAEKRFGRGRQCMGPR